jgi:hypothetical protein
MTNQEIMKNIQAIKCEEGEFKNEIIAAFEDYEYQGITEIIVDFSQKNEARACAASQYAPNFVIGFTEKDGICTVKFVELRD